MRKSLLIGLGFLFACNETPEPAPMSALKAGPDAPGFIRLSWDDQPATTAAVVWHTDAEVSGAGVEFGASEKYGKTAAARNYQIKGVKGYFHEASLKGLTPESLVHYRVGSHTGVSGDYTFQTAPKADSTVPIRFVIEGDSRSESSGVGAGYAQLIARIQKDAPAFILDSGDYTTLSLPNEWVQWMEAGDSIGPIIPRLTTIGNHEIIADTYFGLMDLPKNGSDDVKNQEKWYSEDYGPIHIVSLYTAFGSLDYHTKEWLDKDLAAASGAKWKVVFMHMPPYNAGKHGEDKVRTDIREQWVPLFEKYGVDVVAGGHDHNFQNFGYLKNGVRVADGKGPLYIVSGGAGAPLYDVLTDSSDAPLLLESGKYENYVVVDVDGNKMTLQPKRLDGTPAVSAIVITK
jgi:hypothetical protein